jgi:hypothetical protein
MSTAGGWALEHIVWSAAPPRAAPLNTRLSSAEAMRASISLRRCRAVHPCECVRCARSSSALTRAPPTGGCCAPVGGGGAERRAVVAVRGRQQQRRRRRRERDVRHPSGVARAAAARAAAARRGRTAAAAGQVVPRARLRREVHGGGRVPQAPQARTFRAVSPARASCHDVNECPFSRNVPAHAAPPRRAAAPGCACSTFARTCSSSAAWRAASARSARRGACGASAPSSTQRFRVPRLRRPAR